MEKIELNGKKMNLLEARLLFLGLSFGISKPKLTEIEKKDYLHWKALRENKNQYSRSSKGYNIYGKSSERKYILEKIENKIVDYINSRSEEKNKNKDDSEKFANPFTSVSK